MSHELPSVAGRRLSTSNADFENRCLVQLAEEQEKLMPDNALIALLCDGVRLTREYTDEMTGKIPASLPVTDGVWEALEAIRKDVDMIGGLHWAFDPGSSLKQDARDLYARLDVAVTRALSLRTAPPATKMPPGVVQAMSYAAHFKRNPPVVGNAKYVVTLADYIEAVRAAPPLPESPWNGMESAPQDGRLLWLLPTDEIERMHRHDGGLERAMWFWSGDEWRKPWAGHGVAAGYVFKGWEREVTWEELKALEAAYPDLKFRSGIRLPAAPDSQKGGEA